MRKHKALLLLLGAAMMLPAHLHAAGAGCSEDYTGFGEYTARYTKTGQQYTNTYTGNAIQSSPRADGIQGYTTYYPYGTKTTTTNIRYTRFVYGLKVTYTEVLGVEVATGASMRGRYCLEETSSAAPPVAAPSMKQCTSCGDAAYGWQVMIVSSRNISTDLMKAPIVVSQGFDPAFTSDKEFSFTEFENSFKAVYPASGANSPSFPANNALKRLVGEGFDVVFVKYNNPSLNIRTQGKNFLEAMNWVASKSVPNSSMYLVGPSMGGQVVRSALIEYYDQKAANNLAVAKTRINGALLFDSPNLGASIPSSGFFAMRKHSDFDATAKYMTENMKATAAQQMLYRAASGDSWTTNSTAASFYADLNSPNNIRKMTQDGKIDIVAISNGSAAGVSQGIPVNTTYFSGNDQLYRQVIDVPVLGKFTLTGTMSTAMTTASASSNSPFTWGLTFAGMPASYDKTYQTGDSYLENSPGGYRGTFKQLTDALSSTYSRNVTLNTSVVNHSFIPTISSLGLTARSLGNSSDLNRAVVAVGNKPQESSIFSRIYAPQVNQPHVALTYENAGWMLQEIKWAFAKKQYLGFTSVLN